MRHVKKYTASKENWNAIQEYAELDCYSDACILELKSRIEALEDMICQQQAIEKYRNAGLISEATLVKMNQTDSLVDRVAEHLTTGSAKEARAAILEIASAIERWFDSQDEHCTAYEAATWLIKEAQ